MPNTGQLKAALAASEVVEPGLVGLVPGDFKDQVSPELQKMAVKRAPVRSKRTGASMEGLLQTPPGSEWGGDLTQKTLVGSAGGFNYAFFSSAFGASTSLSTSPQ